MSTATTRTSKRKAKTASDTSNSATSTTTTTIPSRSTGSILTPGPSASTSASIPSSLHQSAFSIPVRASSPQSSQQSLAPTLPQLPLASSVFASSAATLPSSTVSQPDNQTDDESDSPDSNAVDDSQQRASKKLKSEHQPANDATADSSPTTAASPTTQKKQPEPELSDAAKHVLFERRWSPQYAADWSSSSALSLHLSWQKLIDQLQQQFGVRWTKKKLADAADHAKKVYVDRRKASRLPGHRTPQPWKWHSLMEQWLGQAMTDAAVKDEPDTSSTTANTGSTATTPSTLQPSPPAVADSSKAGGRGPAPPLPNSASVSAAAGGGQSPAMDGALNHAIYATLQDSQRRHEELARTHSEKLDRLLAMMQTVVERLPAAKSD